MTQRLKSRRESDKQREILEKVFDHIPIMINVMDQSGGITLVNHEWERVLGWTQEEISTQTIDIMSLCYPDPAEHKRAMNFVSTNGVWGDFKTTTRDGRVISTSWAMVHLSDGTMVGIGQDITERRFVEEQLRALTASLQSAREEEGSRIARAVHDELGTSLTSFKWDLESMDRTLSEPETASRIPLLQQKIQEMIKLTDNTVEAVRRIASQLRPRILDDLGLSEAIEWQAQQFQAETGIPCRYRCAFENADLNHEQSTVVFRILSEALTNIRRHAEATGVQVSIKEESGNLILAVGDNGRGINEKEIWARESLGLLGMRERARILRGEIEITGVEGIGTLLTLRVPIKQK